MAKKKGLITNVEIAENRENAIKIGESIKREFKNLIQHRINHNTVIFIRSDQDKGEQIERFVNRLNKDRLNY